MASKGKIKGFRICKFCGKEYEVIKSRDKSSKFCSKECMDNYKKLENNQYNNTDNDGSTGTK